MENIPVTYVSCRDNPNFIGTHFLGSLQCIENIYEIRLDSNLVNLSSPFTVVRFFINLYKVSQAWTTGICIIRSFSTFWFEMYFGRIGSIATATRTPSQYPKRRLFVRSSKVSKPRDWYFKLPYRFEIWQAEVPVKFQSDLTILNTNLAASTLYEILRKDVFSDIETGPRSHFAAFWECGSGPCRQDLITESGGGEWAYKDRITSWLTMRKWCCH